MESLANPVALVKGARPKLPRGRDRRLLPGEEPRILTACRAYGGPIESLVILALETAMRWEHLDRQARVLRVPETKTGEPRRVKPDATMLTDLRFHDLRHEATSRLFEIGLNPMQTAAITGHQTLQMFKRYTHLRVEDLVDRLG